jgi:predicted Rossmann-fold nucleotide-binding protein
LTSDSQIFVSGTWRPDKAAAYADDARRVGQLIAEAGYSLGCGPGTGIARHAIDGFRSVSDRPGKVLYFLPAEAHMQAVGEEVQPGADEIIQTDLDYPMRNVHQISKSVGLIIITGGDGALEEVLPALADYDLPVSAQRGSGQAALALEALVRIFPEWERNVLIAEEPDDLARFVLDRAGRRAGTADPLIPGSI